MNGKTETQSVYKSADRLVLRTSEEQWLTKLAQAYKHREPVMLVDDLGVGIDPGQQTLLEMGKDAGLSKREWLGVLTSLGVSLLGALMILAALFDPEPTSKLGILLAGGALCAFTGGISAIRVVTRHKPPKVTATKGGRFTIEWED